MGRLCGPSLVHNNVINCPHTARAGKIDMHASAGSDRGPDYFSFAVQHMTATVENVRASIPVLVDNERFGRLITCRLACLNRFGDVRSSYRDSLL